jgi:murein DD-endopeptidase MepM/ murein hydrolase activator NlpD
VTVLPSAGAPGAGPAADARLRDASRQLESILLRQIVETSGVFKGGDGAGSAVRAGLFAEALADAVASAGGIGLADQVERALGGGRPAAPPAPAPAPGPSPLPPLGLPAEGRISSAFGLRRDPFTREEAEHRGLDVAAPEGAPIHAPLGGVVVRAGPRGGYGNAIEIDHGGGVATLYGHASEVAVAPGEWVAAGQEIGRVGRTGRATGPHLHFEVRLGGRPVDPARVLKTYAARVEGSSGPDPGRRRLP